MPLLIPVITLSAVLAGFEALGLDTDALLQAIGMERQQLADPYTSVPNEAVRLLWMAAFAQDPRPDLPARAGVATPSGAFDVLDHLVSSAQTVGEGLHTLRLFFRLVAATIRIELAHGAEDWLWLVNNPPMPWDVISHQWTLAIVVQRFGAMVPGFAVAEVHLTQPPSLPAATFETHFGAPVRLGQPQSGMRLQPGVWSLPISTTNLALHTTLRTLAERIEVKAFQDDPLRYMVQARLPEAIQAGTYSAEQMAEQVGCRYEPSSVA